MTSILMGSADFVFPAYTSERTHIVDLAGTIETGIVASKSGEEVKHLRSADCRQTSTVLPATFMNMPYSINLDMFVFREAVDSECGSSGV